MVNHFQITDVIILLVAAVGVVSLCRALKLSSIVGYLLAGTLIGPHAFGFVKDVTQVSFLGEFGVVFLLFSIGLKMPLRRFQVLKRYVFGLGLTQVLLSAVTLSLVGTLLKLPYMQAFLVGSALALSSTAVGLQLLTEQGELGHKHGRASFAVLLSQDVAVIVLLTMMSTLTQQEHSLISALTHAGLKAALVLISIVIIGQMFLSPLFRFISNLNNPELFIAVTLLVVLTTSLATSAVGLSKELGAFLAGLMLSETEYRHQVEADIQPFYGIFLGLFFMTVGMEIDLNLLMNKAHLIALLLLAFLVIKGGIIYGLCRLFKIPPYSSMRTTMVLAAGGEFAFILLNDSLDKGLIPHEIISITILAVALSMLLTPFLVQLGRYIGGRFPADEGASVTECEGQLDDLRDHIIIAGFGRVGKLLAGILSERMIPFVALDHEMATVTVGRNKGFPVYYGDSTRDTVLKSLGASKAAAVVISLHNAKASLKTALMVRRKFPHVTVAVRMEDDAYEKKLEEVGAIVIKPENLEPSLKLAAVALRSIGIADPEVTQVIDQYRRNYLNPTTAKTSEAS
jgi:CPA2 family monovalent cation:H+ antiporter-2